MTHNLSFILHQNVLHQKLKINQINKKWPALGGGKPVYCIVFAVQTHNMNTCITLMIDWTELTGA